MNLIVIVWMKIYEICSIGSNYHWGIQNRQVPSERPQVHNGLMRTKEKCNRCIQNWNLEMQHLSIILWIQSHAEVAYEVSNISNWMWWFIYFVMFSWLRQAPSTATLKDEHMYHQLKVTAIYTLRNLEIWSSQKQHLKQESCEMTRNLKTTYFHTTAPFEWPADHIFPIRCLGPEKAYTNLLSQQI